jgi:glutathione S-transferase
LSYIQESKRWQSIYDVTEQLRLNRAKFLQDNPDFPQKVARLFRETAGDDRRVRQYLAGSLKADEATVTAWMRHWIELGFAAVERLLDADGPYACGPAPTMADVVLVPQVFNARRIGMALDAWPRIVRADAAARGLAEFAAAAPDRQPDFGS